MGKKKQNLKFRATALRKDDEVIVISGKEKGKRGKIMFIDRTSERVIVQGVNKIKRFNRPTQENPQGGVIELESGLPLSNVMFYDAKLKKGVRLGFDLIDGKKARVTRTKERKEV